MLVDAVSPQTPDQEGFDPLVGLAQPADELAVEFPQCPQPQRRVTIHPLVQAIGVDLDPEVLSWGRDNNLARLSRKQRDRITLLEENVLTAKTEKADVISAMNFSYWLIQERAALKSYFEAVRRALKKDGVMFLDAYGGYDSHKEIVEEREIDDGGQGFTYIWEQSAFDPITHRMHSHIHFAFPDSS